MKNGILLLIATLFVSGIAAQNILVVNDNDYITYNTDTLLSGLDNSLYHQYDYWNIPDSAGVFPSASFMSEYDLVIWYCSTDGVGLKVWDGVTAGNAELISHIISGKKVWIIGQDILYQFYNTGTSFFTGDFAHDYLGLASYDAQSYGNDGGNGVPQLDKTSFAPAFFPSPLNWIFPTLWYADGCTENPGVTPLYQMGPASYVLAGSKSMFRNQLGGLDVMSTFFDPALINTFENRILFLEKSIGYILEGLSTVKSLHEDLSIRLYPNPANTVLFIETDSMMQGSGFTLLDISGKPVLRGKIGSGNTSLELDNLPGGIYILCVDENLEQTFRVIKK